LTSDVSLKFVKNVGRDRFHASLIVVAEDDDVKAQVVTENGATSELRTRSGMMPGAAGYVGVVPARFTLVFEAMDGEAGGVEYSINLISLFSSNRKPSCALLEHKALAKQPDEL
jgi:hypothetical protein